MDIVSTMGSGSLGRELDLDALVDALQDAVEHDLNPSYSDSGMITVRLEAEGVAYLFYRSGSFQIRGAENEVALEESQRRLREVFELIGLEVPEYSFEQRTAVFMENLDQSIDLGRLMIGLGFEHTEYEPEQFPALIYKPPNINVTLLIFSSGKIIIGGTMSKHTAQKAINHLTEHLD